VKVANLIAEAHDLNCGSLARASEIDFATAGTQLGPVVTGLLDKNPAPFTRVRTAVAARLDELGGAGEKVGLFMLAADMATTKELVGDRLSKDERSQLRDLWDHLRTDS
jgi:hypothetical protein